VARSVLPSTVNGLVVPLLNATGTPRLLRNGTCLGTSEPVQVVTDDERNSEDEISDETEHARQWTTQTGNASAEIVDSMIGSLPADLNDSQRDSVRELLETYQDVLSKDEYDVGRTDLVHHTIDTGEHRPIRQTLRRHPVTYLETIDQQVDEIIRHDIVEPAASPWASNVVLLRKKDETVRFCVD